MGYTTMPRPEASLTTVLGRMLRGCDDQAATVLHSIQDGITHSHEHTRERGVEMHAHTLAPQRREVICFCELFRACNVMSCI